MLTRYYNEDAQHDYMGIEKFDRLIFDFLKRLNLQGSTVLEVGSGFGRYTNALSKLAKNVIASEPNDHMFKVLEQNFREEPNTKPVKADLSQIIGSQLEEKIEFIFLFHVLHHMELNTFAQIQKALDKFGATVVILEPNHLNPLFFFQIFVTKDMKYNEEKRMMVDNSALLSDAHFSEGYQVKREFLGILPPGMTNKMAKYFEFFSSSEKLSTNFKNPFSAYSILTIKKA